MIIKKITIHIDYEPQEIVVSSVRKLESIRRSELMLEASKNPPSAENQTAFYLYPTCVCSVREPEFVRDMTFEQFLHVDEQDMLTWAEAGYEANPQWKSAMQALVQLGEEESEKKTGTPSNGSPTPTVEPMTT